MRRLIFAAAALALAAAIATTAALAVSQSNRSSMSGLMVMPMSRSMSTAMSGSSKSSTLASQLALARLATSKYVTNLDRANADGYGIITRMIPDMGYHYLNPNVQGFDVRKPPILVYERRGARWQLGALEWIFPTKPTTPPLPGARYGSFGAACHYVDGTFLFADSQDKCAQTSPQTGAKFNFWHPPLVTLHVWIWYPNPSGLFASMNPLVSVYNKS
jgi:hypothetical protein